MEIYSHSYNLWGWWYQENGFIYTKKLTNNTYNEIYIYIIWTSIDEMKDNGFKLTKERSRRYPAQTITDADYADDIALLANTPTQVETQLHSLERAAASRGFHVNTHKTEYMCFNQRGDIFTLNGSSLRLVDKFTNLGNSVSSTETDINTRLAKAWTATIGYRSYGSQT